MAATKSADPLSFRSNDQKPDAMKFINFEQSSGKRRLLNRLA